MKKILLTILTIVFSLLFIASTFVCKCLNLVEYRNRFSDLELYPLHKNLAIEFLILALVFLSFTIIEKNKMISNKTFALAISSITIVFIVGSLVLASLSFKSTYTKMYTFIPNFLIDAEDDKSDYSENYNKYFSFYDILSSQESNYQLSYSRIDTKDTVYIHTTQISFGENFEYFMEYFQSTSLSLYNQYSKQYEYYYNEFLNLDPESITYGGVNFKIYSIDTSKLFVVQNDETLFTMVIDNPDFAGLTDNQMMDEATKQYSIMKDESQSHIGERGNILSAF